MAKAVLIPRKTTSPYGEEVKVPTQVGTLDDVPASYQAVGEVTAHQTDDGYPALKGERTHWN